ncbi:hypothetical protein RHMOL_Rhmol08G0009700 [Rhododendron molle]|uniref:Uncharacterized protein n=1 Tax=Rhododendron molle TaxID=49168 RepID=A0ACC0MIA2_RHOML|nr:hypothetical protein RHMOL_Rhmol08G0009700 [Rhododendron molle]
MLDPEGILLELVADGTICPVCQSLFAHSEHVATLLCFHFYHLECMDGMVAHGMFNCAVCRDAFDETIIFEYIIPSRIRSPIRTRIRSQSSLTRIQSPPVPSTPSCWGAY